MSSASSPRICASCGSALSEARSPHSRSNGDGLARGVPEGRALSGGPMAWRPRNRSPPNSSWGMGVGLCTLNGKLACVGTGRWGIQWPFLGSHGRTVGEPVVWLGQIFPLDVGGAALGRQKRRLEAEVVGQKDGWTCGYTRPTHIWLPQGCTETDPNDVPDAVVRHDGWGAFAWQRIKLKSEWGCWKDRGRPGRAWPMG
jgi:hypothetical protein